MKRILRALAVVCLLTAGLFGQSTTVSATLNSLTGTPITSGAYMQFTLKAFNGNPVRVVGANWVDTKAIVVRPDGNGLISTPLQGNDTLTAYGINDTYYLVEVYDNGTKIYGAPFKIVGVSFNLNTQPPLSGTPPSGMQPTWFLPLTGGTVTGLLNVIGTLDVNGSPTCTTTNCPGQANETVTFTNATSASLTTSYAANNLVWACYDNAIPSNEIEPGNVTLNPSTLVMTFSFLVPQTGYCAINGTGGSGGGVGGGNFYVDLVSSQQVGGNKTWTGLQTVGSLNGACIVDGIVNPTLAAAVACAGVSGVVEIPMLYVSPMAANVTIPVGVTLKFDGPSCITTTGYTLTINGSLQAPDNAQIFCGTGTVAGLESPHPAWFPGVDIGAQINAATASCVAGQQCHIIIPPSAQLAYTTPIVFAGAGTSETVECTRTGAVSNSPGWEPYAILDYTGSGTAVTMGGSNGRFIGCDLLLGASATTGIRIGGSGATAYSNHIEDVDVRNGGTGTTLVKISCPSGACEDNHLINSRLSSFIGVGVELDHSNDTHLVNNTAYALATSNATSISLLIDSAGAGVNVNGFIGGSSGLHGMVVQHTLGGGYPTFGFIQNFECDISSSDCIVFDSSLGSAPIGYILLNSWAAGSGGAGIHISGGSNISIGAGTIVRVNALDGILIDGASVVNVQIQDSIIQGNNASNAGYSGISIANHPAGVIITGNHINDAPESGGYQQYALKANSDVEGLIFANNNCANNVVGCANTTAVNGGKLTYYGNINVVSGLSNERNYFPGGIQIPPAPLANIPTCVAGLEGLSWPITNSNTATYNAVITGIGAYHVVAYCNGTYLVAH